MPNGPDSFIDPILRFQSSLFWLRSMTPIWPNGGSKHGISVPIFKNGSGRRHVDMNGAVSPR